MPDCSIRHAGRIARRIKASRACRPASDDHGCAPAYGVPFTRRYVLPAVDRVDDQLVAGGAAGGVGVDAVA
jgi:hypothetical protein